jgi:uncharacterized glyoxalase superfamily protein PhnB
MKNRSVPTDMPLPHLVYRDVGKAAGWLARAFGFVEHFHYGGDGKIDGAQMRLGDSWIMLHGSRPGSKSPAEAGIRTQSLTIFLADVDEHFERTKAAGARIVEDLHETVYGERQYGVEDLDGHLWIFSQHARDLSPDEWGATIVTPLRPQC